MFGTNPVVGAKHFKKKDVLVVASRFFTLQGEGPLQGQPSIFVRLAHCQLQCHFCDTYFSSGTEFTYKELLNEIQGLLLYHWKVVRDEHLPKWAQLPKRKMNLVITGGEPSLQANLIPFIQIARRQFAKVQIESNGLIHREWAKDTILIISPKCSEKEGKAVKYLEPNKFNLERANALKFVLNSDLGSPYSTIPDWALEWKRRKHRPIYVSPLNVYNHLPNQAQRVLAGSEASIETRSLVDEVISFWTPGLLNQEANQRNHEYAAKYALDYGLYLTLQMHLYAGLA